MRQVIKFFKPFQVLCQFTDQSNRRTLKDFIPLEGVYAAGRLDYRSEGLLVLTTDGTLIQRLSDPKFEHPKIYFAQVEGVIKQDALEKLNQQIVLPGLQTRPVRATVMDEPELPSRSIPVRDYHPTSWLKIELFEGKKHQIRRLTAAVGFPTLRLIRFAIGEITLLGLQPGEWKRLDAHELKSISLRSRQK
jgi:pseudouridine synthase